MVCRRFQRMIPMIGVGLAISACQDLTSKLPAGAVDPKFYATPEAARQMAAEVRYEFQRYIIDFSLESGRIADEFDDKDSLKRIQGEFDEFLVLTQRHLPDEINENTPLSAIVSKIKSYGYLHRIRSIASLARKALEMYAPEDPPDAQGEMYAYEAFADIMLADLYCSGIPLSTVDFNEDYTYRPASRTHEVYQEAIYLLDSAMTLAIQNPQIKALIQVGKARALLALGLVSDAANVVRGIPEGFQFTMPLYLNPNQSAWARVKSFAVGDRKGEIGLPFASARDPRALVVQAGFVSSGYYWILQDRTEFVVASYVEARLIEAEALIQAGDGRFIDVLNELRTDGTFSVGVSGDTVYNAGTGGVTRLAPLVDPGLGTIPPGRTALDLRIDLLMRERAYWLFFTGHRQGDLRRLIRNYGRTVENVYPRGESNGGFGSYDTYIDVPIPNDERFNPHFLGCLGRGE